MLEITRELVEHYLRATGWTCLGGNPVAYRSVNAEYDVVLQTDSMPRTIQYIAAATKTPRHLVAFRLGLCAAANKLISSAHATEKMNTPPDDILFALVGEDRMQAHELLRLAGVDPIAWESARKR